MNRLIQPDRRRSKPASIRILVAMTVFLLSAAWSANSSAQSASPQAAAAEVSTGGPIRLRQTGNAAVQPARSSISVDSSAAVPRPVDEFETFVQGLSGNKNLRRFGADIIAAGATQPEAADFSPLVPPDYLIQPGDEISLLLWGSVDADLRLVVDRTGRVSIPRVGAIMLAGVRYADLTAVISQRVALVFKGYQLSVSLGQLRGIRIYITGFVSRPGAYTVSSLTTLTSALIRAGGPSAAGSFRHVQLRRGSEAATDFDFYRFLLGGDRSGDRVLQADDVVHVDAIGPQVAMIGSVNQPAIYEIRSGETLADALRMAGGLAAVADTARLSLERLDDRDSIRITQLDLPRDSQHDLRNGDVLRAINSVDFSLPVQRQNKHVRIEGEVPKPGEYVLPASSSLSDLIRAAGGLTPAAYVYGAEFTRERVRATQTINYERALRDLETDFAKANTSRRVASADESAAQAANAQATSRLIERLRASAPTGRIVLPTEPASKELPALALEDGDRLLVPPRPTSVGVFGSVFNGGSYIHSGGRSVDDYLRLAGGPTRGADPNSVFVVRANGSVVSARQQDSSWFGSHGMTNVTAEAGDTIFVPEELDKITFVQSAKDWTQILYQFGIGLAGMKSAIK
jgi:protein involved in polysaccharide export with SLBB domain